MVLIKNYEINLPRIKDSHNRRCQKFKNNIISSLRALGLTEDDVDIEIIPVAMKCAQAKASWWIEGCHLYYSYKGGNFAENLGVIAKVIDLEVKQVLQGEKTVDEFIADFHEDPDVDNERKKAREYLGVDEHATLLEINKKYRQLAKVAHPDMSTGDTHTFKKLNRAHKILKRELS